MSSFSARARLYTAAAPEMISMSSRVMTACLVRLYLKVSLSIISPTSISRSHMWVTVVTLVTRQWTDDKVETTWQWMMTSWTITWQTVTDMLTKEWWFWQWHVTVTRADVSTTVSTGTNLPRQEGEGKISVHYIISCNVPAFLLAPSMAVILALSSLQELSFIA